MWSFSGTPGSPVRHQEGDIVFVSHSVTCAPGQMKKCVNAPWPRMRWTYSRSPSAFILSSPNSLPVKCVLSRLNTLTGRVA